MVPRKQDLGRSRGGRRVGPAAAVFPVLSTLVLSFGLCGPAAAAPEARVLPHTREEIQLSYAPLVRQVAPAVVDVFTRRTGRGPSSAPLLDDRFLRQFFGDEGPLGGAERQHLLRSLGSGVIVDPKGLVVTTDRVIADEPDLGVALSDGHQYAARLVLRDRRSGLAVLSIQGGNGPFPALALRDSDHLAVGDLVLAVGDPFGLGPMVTSGVLSALEPSPEAGRSELSFIRTDATIGPANQGGALVTMDGRLAGIAALIGPRSARPAVGFVIPSNVVARVVQAALSGRGLARAWFGADFATVPPVSAQAAGHPGKTPSASVPTDSLRVASVYPGGPAERAGIRPGDLVTAIDGRGVTGPRSLQFRIAGATVGEHVLVSVARGSETLNLPMVLEAPPSSPAPDYLHVAGTGPLAGATLANLSPALADRLDIDLLAKGVAITGVKPGSPADRLKLAAGDRIVDLDGTRVVSTRQIEHLLSPRRRHWKIAVQRGDEPARLIAE